MKNLLNLGKALSKAEQQTINGGTRDLPCELIENPTNDPMICGGMGACFDCR